MVQTARLPELGRSRLAFLHPPCARQRDALDRVYALLRSCPRLRRAGGGGGGPDLDSLGISTDDALAFRAARGAWGRRARQLLGEGGGWWDDVAALDPEGACGGSPLARRGLRRRGRVAVRVAHSIGESWGRCWLIHCLCALP
jgi:hypothetical protein